MVAVLPSIMALETEPSAKAERPDDDDVPGEGVPVGVPVDPDAQEKAAYEADPTPNLVDLNANEACSDASAWPILTSGESKGKLTLADPADWSRVYLLRTESLAASTTKGAVTLESAKSCDKDLLLGGAVADAEENGWAPLRVSASDTFEGYRLKYAITANDARSGGDLWHESSLAFSVNAMPEANPTQRMFYPGSLPHRGDEPFGPDVDWFRITTGLAQNPDGEGERLNLGLLNVYFDPDCYVGDTTFTLFQADATTRIHYSDTGCGPTLRSCIAASFSSVYAKLEADLASGLASYDFAAEVSPLAIVAIEEGVEITTLDPEQPWCDPVTPLALAAAANASGEPWGVQDKQGRVVARVNTGSA